MQYVFPSRYLGCRGLVENQNMTAKRPSILASSGRRRGRKCGLKMTATRMARQRDEGNMEWGGRRGTWSIHRWERHSEVAADGTVIAVWWAETRGNCARHNSILGEFVGPNCARDCDGPPYRTFWAVPRLRRVSLQCSCLFNT